MPVVDRLQTVHVQEQNGEGALRPLRSSNLPLEHAHQPAIIRQARQRVGHRQMSQLRFDAVPLGHDGRERQNHDGGDPHERLQQEE